MTNMAVKLRPFCVTWYKNKDRWAIPELCADHLYQYEDYIRSWRLLPFSGNNSVDHDFGFLTYFFLLSHKPAVLILRLRFFFSPNDS